MRGCLGLFTNGRHDFRDALTTLTRRTRNLFEGKSRFSRQFDAARHTSAPHLDRANGVITLDLDRTNQAANFLRTREYPVREFFDLVGDDRKRTTVLSGLGGNDGCVECKQVGLFCHVVDHVKNGANFLSPSTEATDYLLGSVRRVLDRPHAVDRL